MSLQAAKAIFQKYQQMFGESDTLRGTVDGTLKMIETLEASHYFDDVAVKETLFALEFPVSDREGRVILSYDVTSDKYFIRGQKTPVGEWLDAVRIYNTDNPIQEIEAYIEQVRPLMETAWKR